jgi:glycosyltransferase involved in cell wall biosynthesis
VRDLWPSGGIELGLIKPGLPAKLALWFEKLCYNNADHIVTASPGQKQHILNRFPKKEIEVVPNASDLDLFGKPAEGELPDWAKGKCIYTHIGSLGLIHNTAYWLDVARELKSIDTKQEVILVFIGDGVDRHMLEEEKQRFALNNLHFLGLKPKNELPLWVQNSCATLFATTSNPVQDTSSPNKVFDSFAAGVPILQTSKGWIADLVEKENCGVNIPLKDPALAAQMMLDISRNKEYLDELGANALTLARTQFNRDHLANSYLELIKSVVNKKAPFRLIYFYQYFGTPKGSWSTRVYELSKRWVEQGVDVTVVTSPYYKSDIEAKGFISVQQVEGIRVIVINAADSNKHGFLKRTVNAIVFALMSLYYALTWRYDVIVCSSGPLTIGLPGIFGSVLRKKYFVFEVRDLWPQGSVELKQLTNKVLIRLAYWFERRCYKNAQLVVPCSVGMESSILNRYPKTNTCVIPNASDSSFFYTPHEEPTTYPDFVQDKYILLYAGSLGLMDDCMQIVKAAKLIRDYPIAIVFAGDGAEKPILEREVEKFGLTNVFFTGLLPKTDIIKWFFLSKASLVTFKDHPVLSTNSPNKMFDSFAAGVPIIQTTKGWIKDMVIDSYCGLNAEPHDPQSLADVIIWLYNHEAERQRMAQNALHLAKTVFNRDYLAKDYLKAIKKLLPATESSSEPVKA